jgi:intein/homing endonuclease
MRETQLGLLRLGIISSLYSYDNSENPYSENTRYTVSISDQKSLEKFHNKIGFTCEEKAKELEQIVQENKNRQKNRQVLRSGIKVRQTIEEHGHSMEDFKEANTYLQGDRNIGLQGDRNIGDNAFKRNLVDEAQEPLKTKLSTELGEPDVRPTQVKSIQKLGPSKTIDISTGAGNFIANGVVVHNSAQRFARIRENMYDQFMKEIADKAKNAFLQKGS